jgi:hypothetical protein
MDFVLLRKLRRRQALVRNCSLLLAVIFFGFLTLIFSSTKTLFLLTGAINLILMVKDIIGSSSRFTITEKLLPSFKPLIEYEQSKLGTEKRELRITSVLISLISVVTFLFLGAVTPYDSSTGIPVLTQLEILFPMLW